jgi:hypothetical protein
MMEARLEIAEWSGTSSGCDEEGQWVDLQIRGRIR